VAVFLIPLLYLLWLLTATDWQAGSSLEILWKGPTLVGLRLPLFITLLPLIGLEVFLFLKGREMKPDFSITEVEKNMCEGIPHSPTGSKRYAVCGHTHRPKRKKWENANTVYLNCGTWIPVFEYINGIIRDDLTMTFVELKREKSDWEGEVLRWLPHINVETEVILTE